MDATESSVTGGGNGQSVPPQLNARQALFVREYLTDLNASAAYRRAGYRATGNAVSVNACRLLGNAKIRAAITAAQKERAERLQLKADDIIRELARVGLSDIGSVVEWGVEDGGFMSFLTVPAATVAQSVKALRSVKVVDANGKKFGNVIDLVGFSGPSVVVALRVTKSSWTAFPSGCPRRRGKVVLRGEQTDAVLRTILGLGAEEIGALRAASVVA